MAGSEGAIGIGWPRLTFEPAGSRDPGCSGRGPDAAQWRRQAAEPVAWRSADKGQQSL